MLTTNLSYAEQIPITLSGGVSKIIFDGKWTFKAEWKQTSLIETEYNDGNKMVIRTAHDYENIYLLIDFVSDTSIQKFGDRGIVCIDSKVDRGSKLNSNDYCFSVTVGSKKPHTLQGDNNLAMIGFLKKIENHPEFIAIGGVSDENDRYSKIPHASYEFKIPVEVVGRSNIYGFYVGAYEGKTGKVYSWPSESSAEKYPFIPSPNKWGELTSPDKTIPEFGIANFLLFCTMAFLIILTRHRLFQIMCLEQRDFRLTRHKW